MHWTRSSLVAVRSSSTDIVLYVPCCFTDRDGTDGWKSERAFDLLIRIISRLASRLFVGPELCRNEEWLSTSRGYTENVFRAIIFLRIFPT